VSASDTEQNAIALRIYKVRAFIVIGKEDADGHRAHPKNNKTNKKSP
jgi:hypothetical protein